jgi:GntR family transcriptional regulator/MocR family aminotransferase
MPLPRHRKANSEKGATSLIGSGAYKRHIRRVRRWNGECHATLLAALKAILGEAVTVVGADAGLHVVVWLNDVARAQEDMVTARAHKAGLGVYSITSSYVSYVLTDRPELAGLVMGYAGLDEHGIERGVRTLKLVLRTLTDAGT